MVYCMETYALCAHTCRVIWPDVHFVLVHVSSVHFVPICALSVYKNVHRHKVHTSFTSEVLAVITKLINQSPN